MKPSILAALALALVALSADPAFAQRGRNSGVHTAYGSFSQAEMRAAGNDPVMAMQIRQQQQMQMQMMQQQKQAMQMQKQQADFLKKNPEAAKALINSYTPKPTAKKATKADAKKADAAKPADAATPAATKPAATTTATKPATVTARKPK